MSLRQMACSTRVFVELHLKLGLPAHDTALVSVSNAMADKTNLNFVGTGMMQILSIDKKNIFGEGSEIFPVNPRYDRRLFRSGLANPAGIYCGDDTPDGIWRNFRQVIAAIAHHMFTSCTVYLGRAQFRPDCGEAITPGRRDRRGVFTINPPHKYANTTHRSSTGKYHQLLKYSKDGLDVSTDEEQQSHGK